MSTATLTEWDKANKAPVRAPGAVALAVDFDPQSLELTYSTGATDPGAAPTASGSGTAAKAPTQQTSQRSTLGFTLLFDTSTQRGVSVQTRTDLLVALTTPRPQPDGSQARRVVQFLWGSFLFYGCVDSMSQTIDFFSDAGVPLRASVRLSLTEISDPPSRSGSGAGAGAGIGASFGASVGLSASAGVSAGASFGVGAAAGASLGAGVGAGASFGAGAGAAASFGGAASFSGSGSASFGGGGLSLGASAGVGTTPLTLSRDGDTIQAIAARSGGAVSWRAVATANGIDNPRLLPPGTVLAAGGSVTATASVTGRVS